MNKIKVLYIITKSDIGGAQKYVSDLANNLDKNKFEAKIIYGGKDLRWLSNSVQPWFLFINDWLAIWEIYRILKLENPNIIHLNSSKAGVLGALAAQVYKVISQPIRQAQDKKLKVIFTAHGWVFNPTNHLNPLSRFFYIAMHKFAGYLQNEIICVSEYDHQLAIRYGIKPKKNLHTIHNGIDPNIKFLSKEEARREILNKIEGPDFRRGADSDRLSKANGIWIGSIGRLVKEKNYETFIEAASHVKDAIFFLIGEGLELNKLKVESRNSKVDGRFFFVNPSGNDSKYLKAFDIFVMSSIKEGLPYILLEAMAAELPIVVTEAGGIPEIIKNHQNGMMVSQKNPKQLAQAISGLTANPPIAAELGKYAKKAVIENFSLKKMVEETEGVYKSLKSESL